jgi:hypothetical protein
MSSHRFQLPVIDHNKKAIYLHIGKAAGTSIEKMMSPEKHDAMVADRHLMFGYDKEEGLYLQHASAETTRRLVGEAVFRQYYKFTIVRNPYSRMLSVYHYLIDQHKQQFGSFQAYIEALPGIVDSPQTQKGSHHIPQTFYTHIDGEFICDYVGKFEELPVSIEPVRVQLDMENSLQKHNARRSQNWSRRPVAYYYTSSMRQIMQEIYADDFACFDYSTDPKDIPWPFWEEHFNRAKNRLRPYVPYRVKAFIRGF